MKAIKETWIDIAFLFASSWLPVNQLINHNNRLILERETKKNQLADRSRLDSDR